MKESHLVVVVLVVFVVDLVDNGDRLLVHELFHVRIEVIERRKDEFILRFNNSELFSIVYGEMIVIQPPKIPKPRYVLGDCYCYPPHPLYPLY